MSPTKHTIASAIVSTAFGAYTHSWKGALACFLSGILIDLDHIIDFWLAKKQIPRRYSDLHAFCTYEKVGKLYLIFHSYELLMILWFLCLFYNVSAVWLGITVGMTTHIIFDYFTNPLQPFVYFLSYRIKHGFSKAATYPEEYYKKLI